MIDHISNRKAIIQSLREELVGPSPAGKELDISTLPLKFDDREKSYGPFIVKGTGEEIIIRDYPTKRYGIGVLYPFGSKEDEPILNKAGNDAVGMSVHSHEDEAIPISDNDTEVTKRVKSIEDANKSIINLKTDENPIDYDLSLANAYQPSSMGITFLAEVTDKSKLVIKFDGGRYLPIPVSIETFEAKWWIRKSVTVEAEIQGEKLFSSEKVVVSSNEDNITFQENTENLNIRFEVFSRQYGDTPELRLITVSFVNRTDNSSKFKKDAKCVFQSHFTAKIISEKTFWNILPYPNRSSLNDEERSIDLLYRHFPTFCVGHGCAGNWDKNSKNTRASTVYAEVLPTFETPSTTPDIDDNRGNKIKVPMAPLAGLVADNDGFDTLTVLIKHYENWINEKEVEIQQLSPELVPAATRHMNNAQVCALRMKSGLKFLRQDQLAAEAFRLANHAILLQQIRPKDKRPMRFNEVTFSVEFDKYDEVDPLAPGKFQGSWRAFQIAFLLMTIESTALGTIPDREIVELIWFPTGGGKTEAYLGLIAFSIFLRRLRNPKDQGVNVLMRYTLRLLTTQQFQRASKLILAMEKIRRQFSKKLGKKEFSIGMWVGGSNTPNTRSDARKIFRDLDKGNSFAENKFILDRCPWCGAEIGPIFYKKKPHKYAPKILGFEQFENTIMVSCPDDACEFSNKLPIFLIDEDVYEYRPSMIIGTVDKFALLAWRPEARSMFGIDKNGSRFCSPPGLIVQDELHLISGPLGSMVGLYEAIIEELCTDRREENPVKPKIVSSTATIRRFEEQIKSLYGREEVTLFPPPGLDAGDSFFAKYAVNEDGSPSPGRLYLGVHAPGLGSMQTAQVRTFTSLLQAPMMHPEQERNPWWTLLLFFNSLRELGTTLSLLQSDIPDYQKVLINRLALKDKKWRGFWEIKELTGRSKNEDIPKALASLELNYPNRNPYPIDVCLASSILEVGVDIDRLSLMAVVGQPKTTSQYIQVTGRVGRSWWERPGLVVTIYSASKPRDRSHFEKFRTYHEKLYAQVEPTSVTPFSPPALDRALHAVIVAYARQLGDKKTASNPYPFPEDLVNEIRGILLSRVQIVDPMEQKNFEKVFSKLEKQWKTWERLKWSGSWKDDNDPLLRRAGAYTPAEKKRGAWETLTSMRNVDAGCIVEIANSVIQGEDDNAE
jgi:hypothetical protein